MAANVKSGHITEVNVNKEKTDPSWTINNHYPLEIVFTEGHSQPELIWFEIPSVEHYLISNRGVLNVTDFLNEFFCVG